MQEIKLNNCEKQKRWEWEKIQAGYAEQNPFYKKVIDSQKKYAEVVVPFKLSWFPPYDFAGKYYWKDKIYLKTQQ